MNLAIPFSANSGVESRANFSAPTNCLKLEMNASRIIAAAVFSLMSVALVQAETYDGVHTMNSAVSRADMAAGAAAMARVGNPYSEAASAGAQPFTSTADRAKVHAEAVAKAHDPLSSIDRRAFYRDELPQAYKKPRVSFTREAGL